MTFLKKNTHTLVFVLPSFAKVYQSIFRNLMIFVFYLNMFLMISVDFNVFFFFSFERWLINFFKETLLKK